MRRKISLRKNKSGLISKENLILRFLISLFIILHGLIHLWFFTLSQGLVKLQPAMREPGWTGKSWFLKGFLGDSSTRSLASILFVIAAVAFVVSGFGIFFRAEWWWAALLGSAIFSSVIIFSLWDGNLKMLIDKGLVGFLISLMILLGMIFLKRTASAF